MNSVSSSRVPKLKRTLKRKPAHRALEDADIKYLWAAYKRGAFDVERGLAPQEFKEQISSFILSNYDNAWILGDIGIIFSVQAGVRQMVGDAQWFPWATKRQKIEHMVGFLDTLRETTDFILECTMADNKFYTYIAKHGIIRRVGHLHSPERVILFESKKWAS